MCKKNEIRTTPGRLLVREAVDQEGNQLDSRTIEGYAIVFNEKSVVLDEGDGRFREVIAPECCTQEFVDQCDIKLTLFHDRQLLLARYMPGRENNSLGITVDEVGVKVSFEAPHTAEGDKALEGIRRGDLTGMSFTFVPDFAKSTFQYDKEERLDIVTHHGFLWLGEMTIGSDPAYQQTSVSAREVHMKTEEGKAELAKMKEQKAAREKAKADADRQRMIELLNF